MSGAPGEPRVQILVRREPQNPESKWEFVAHGARYSLVEAGDTAHHLMGKGCLVSLLPL